MASGTCELELYVHKVAGGAVLLSDTGRRDDATWIPLKHITTSRDDLEEAQGSVRTIELQEWIATDRGLT